MRESLTRSMMIATAVIVVLMVGLMLLFYPEPIAFWLVGWVAAIWGSFIFMAYLLMMFFNRPWDEREKRLAELNAQNDLFRLMFDVTRRVGEAAGAAETIDRGLQASVETLKNELKLEGCSLRGYNKETDNLEPVVGCGYRKDNAKPLPLSAKTGIAGKAIQERRPIFVENPDDEKDFVKPSSDAAPVKALFCVPLIEQGDVVGVLSGSCREVRRFSTHEREILDLIASRLTSLLRIHSAVRAGAPSNG
jgi:transcriptional regulator with GAF, ATPase, and Fis domain